MKLKTLLIIGLLITTSAKAQFEFPSSSARSNAMGGCITTLNDYWTSITNIAGIANIHNIGIGLAFHQNYIISNQSYKSIALTIPTNNIGAFVTTYTHYGNAKYNEQILAMGYALHISPYIALGITLNYLYSNVSDAYYEPLNALTFSTGIQIYPNEKLILGGKISNPIYFYNTSYESIYTPFIFNIGMSYKLFDNFNSTIEFEKKNKYPSTLKIGLEYTIIQFLYARIGFSTATQVIGFGLGWNKNKYSIDFTSQIHPTLGFAPQLSISYIF